MGESDSDQDPYAPPEAGLEVEGSELGRVDLYRAFISGTEAQAARKFVAAKPAEVERYLERFRRRDEVGGLRPGWHWPAFFFTFPWLVFRRMYLLSVLYLVLPLIIADLIETELFQGLPLGVVILPLFFLFTIIFFPPMFADTVYWWHTNRMIRRAQQKFEYDQIAWLRARAVRAADG